MTEREMVFTMGLPAAGKSTAIRDRGLTDTHTVIDCDLFKQEHPDYDPKDPGALHEWSTDEAERMFLHAVSTGEGRWIIDGTGTNAERMIRKMTTAKALGFHITLLYVQVSLTTALRRNAARKRTVPEHIVRSKALDITTSFSLVAPHADKVDVFTND